MGFFERMKKYNYNDVIEIYASCGHFDSPKERFTIN